MSTNKPQPVAWMVKAHNPGARPAGASPDVVQVAVVVGAAVPTVRVVRAGQPLRDLSVVGAESEAAALIMAATVARGEPDNAQALRRAADALGVESTTAAELADADRDALDAAEQARAAAVQEAARLRVQVSMLESARDEAVGQLRDALHMAGDAPWGLLVDVARRLRGERDQLAQHLASAEAALAESQDAAVEKVIKPLRDELRAPAVVRPEGVVWASLCMVREAMDAAAKAAGGDWTCGDCGTLHRKAPPVLQCACGTRRGKPPVGGGDPAPAQAAPAREPMIHDDLASLVRHGVVVGDRIRWASDADTDEMLECVKSRCLRVRSFDAHYHIVIDGVEAPDVD